MDGCADGRCGGAERGARRALSPGRSRGARGRRRGACGARSGHGGEFRTHGGIGAADGRRGHRCIGARRTGGRGSLDRRAR